MEILIALDWTPNPIHAGIFLARAKGWYRELGIDLKLLGVEDDAYGRSTLDKLLSQEAAIAIMPGEMMMKAVSEGHDLVAIGTLLQGNSSCFASLNDVKPGQTVKYGALGLPFEQEIISQLWPNVQVVNPPKLELYQQLFESHVDLVWLYKPIEGVEAEFRGIPLKYFTLEEASVPYGHAPLLVTSRQFIQTHPRELRRLMEVSSRGYLYAAYNLQETIEILFALHVPGMRDRNLLKLQLQALKPYWLNEDEQWGVMNPGRWHKFYEWLHFHSGFQLSETQLETCFTNQFLQYSVIKA